MWSFESLLKPGIRSARPHTDITSGSAQYLMISHPDFRYGLGRLARAREADGLSVMVVDVEDIYAQFGGGIIDPEAIRSYIAYAVENLDTRYVLLVGGDTYDYLDRLGEGSISFIPSLICPNSSGSGLYSPVTRCWRILMETWPRTFRLDGFPVRTSWELNSLIDKTLDYPEASHYGKAIFAADRDESRVSFAQESERMIEKLPGNWSVGSGLSGRHRSPSRSGRPPGCLASGTGVGQLCGAFRSHFLVVRWSVPGGGRGYSG